MFMMDTTEQILILVFLVMSMLSIGMQTRGADLHAIITSKGLMARALLANFLVVPLLGTVLAFGFPLQPHAAGALLLLACTPGGLSTLQFSSQVKGMAPLAGAMMFLLSLFAVVVSPWLLSLVLPGSVKVVVPYGRVLLFLVLFLLLPLLGGMALLSRSPEITARLSRPTALAGVVSFIAFMLLSASFRQAAVGEIGGAAWGAMLSFILLSMAAGWILGGPAQASRQTLASATSMRNAALCLAIVAATSPEHAVIVPLVAFSLLMVPPNMLLTVYSAVKTRKKRPDL